MSVYKDENNKTWLFKLHYKDITGKYKYITRRGFKTKGEARNILLFKYINKTYKIKILS